MAAAYAALVSLSNILHQILHPPPLNNIIFEREQIEFLQGKVNFLIDFLETYSSRCSQELADLERLITNAAYAAEDIIESNVVEQIHAIDREKISTILGEGIQNLLEKFLFIEIELMMRAMQGHEGDLQLKSFRTATSSRPLPGGKITMVGFDNHLIRIMSELTTDESNRRVIPVVGMGGIGKTTLATAVYNDPFIVEHFHVRAWVTLSQEYTFQEILARLLHEINKANPNKQETTSKADPNKPETTDDEPGLQLHKELFDRKYLIVMDDMWNIEAWEKLKMFLPSNENGSRVLVTTRLSNLSVDLGSCTPYKMDFLDEEQSWDLLRKKIFTQEDCPVELEKTGKDIAKRCSGLPLTLVAIGGLLANSERTRENWEFVARDITSALNYGNDGNLMKLLSISYIHLPIYLKPCFLYLAMFPEDFEIRVSTLVRMWVAEGLMRPTRAKCLEQVALEYLEDLISRNLILVHKTGSSGKVRSCKIHDLIRDLCIMQAEKEKFLYISKLDNPNISRNIETVRHLSVPPSKTVEREVCNALRLARFNRSLINYVERFSVSDTSLLAYAGWALYGHESFRLLRVLHAHQETSTDISKLINLRYVSGRIVGLESMSLFWNLQTLVVHGHVECPENFEIWWMPRLRHLKIHVARLKDPPADAQMDGQVAIVLENLQTLSRIRDFKCTDEVIKRIPNLKKLRISYDSKPVLFVSDGVLRCSHAYEQPGDYCLNNLAYLTKLESLEIKCADKLWPDVAFPISLKKLSLCQCKIPWEDLSVVGSLPNLEVLKLHTEATNGEEWNPIEGEFCRLKFLLIWGCELKIWRVEHYHFPCLEHLVVGGVDLEAIPTSFAEISTLQAIHLYEPPHIDSSIWTSAQEIEDHRELLGYDGLRVQQYYGR